MQQSSTPAVPLMRRARITALMLVVALLVSARWVVGVIEDASWDAGATRAWLSLSLLVATTALAAVSARWGRTRSASRQRLGATGIVLVCAACVPTCYLQAELLATRLRSPHLNDIPLTTMAAARVMVAGGNPYQEAVDPRAESRAQGRNYDGFKYMPLMAVTYAPAALMNSHRGVILINTVLHGLMAAMIFLAARSLAGEVAGALGLIFYLWIRLVPRQLFGPGVTDLAAIIPLVAAWWFAVRRPLLGGLLLGISVSMKLVPALALAPVIAPVAAPWRSADSRRFWLGLACGSLPTLVYVLWSPADFASNVFLFNLLRPVDSTSWLYQHPERWRQVAAGALVAVVAGGGVVRWVVRPAPRGQIMLALAVTVGLTLLGPANHGNYQLWWLPWFCIVLGTSLATFLSPPAARVSQSGLT
jgi:hypothetical protein